MNDITSQRGICFLHGWLMSPDIWSASMTAAARRGWRAVALPQPAHGHALPPDGVLSMRAWADQTIDQLRAMGLERCVFVGQSMGGMLALAIADRHPASVLGLGLVSTTDHAAAAEEAEMFASLTTRVSDHWSIEIAAALSGLLIGRAFVEAHPTFLGDWTKAVSAYDVKGMRAVGNAVTGRPDHTAVTAKLHVPVVVIHGEADVAIPVEAAVELASRIPDAKLVRLPAVGHCPPLEAPSAVAAEVIGLAEAAFELDDRS